MDRIVQVMIAVIGVALILLLLTGCGSQPTTISMPVEKLVPVPVARRPPVELLTRVPPPAPIFITPCNPKLEPDCRATSALTKEGEDELRRWVDETNQRLDAWKAWGVEDTQ